MPTTSHDAPSLMFAEGCFAVIAVAAAYAWPRLANPWFKHIERVFGRLARRKLLAVVFVGFATLLLRLAILPLIPAPLPFTPDDFSNLLACNTFARGQLTNPSPAMWTHFETIHVDMRPTYMSMYFPGEGLVLAAGKVLFGNPWFGIVCASALMCAAICWMLQAWMPPGWALLGGILAMLRLGVFSYWVNTYTGAAVISGLGGALVLGALPRLKKHVRLLDGLLMGLGIALLVLTRPYEGLLLCIPVAVVLAKWVFTGKNRPAPSLLLSRAALPLLLVVVAISWLGYYDYRAFGKATTMPYTVNRTTYAIAPYFVWQSARPEPHYRHESLRKFYHDDELKWFNRAHSVKGFVPQTLLKAFGTLTFFTGVLLLVPLIMARRVLLDRRMRFLIVAVSGLMAGMVIEIYCLPHYVAPFTAAFYAIGLQAMRHLRCWNPEGRPVGLMLVRLTIVGCVLIGVFRPFAGSLGIGAQEWPPTEWLWRWYGPEHFGVERARIESELEKLPGPQLVIVQYSPQHMPLNEWVYNSPNPDASKVVWARDMDAANNRELVEYYRDRRVWFVDPDAIPITLRPYSATGASATATSELSGSNER